jgi:predicted GIY-YIG superfamily endonuclease
MPFCVYVLKDPTTDEIRYVGQTNDPIARFERHLVSRGRTHRVRWIRSIFESGSAPKMEVVFFDIETREKACLMEVQVIAALRSHGVKLVNGTDGGEAGGKAGIPFIGRKPHRKKKRRKHGPGKH